MFVAFVQTYFHHQKFTLDTMITHFQNQPFMWNFVESFGKVQKHNINITTSVNTTSHCTVTLSMVSRQLLLYVV